MLSSEINLSKVAYCVWVLLSCALAIFLNGILPITNEVYRISLFWTLILGIYVTTFFQITHCTTRSSKALILFELTVLNLLLHGIYQLQFDLPYGADAYYEAIPLKYILTNGHLQSDYILSDTYLWPLLHIFGASLGLVLKIDLYSIVKITPFVIQISLPVLMFYAFKHILRKHDNVVRISLLSVLFFISIYNQIEFSSMFIRQSIALMMMVLIIYAINSCLSDNCKYIVMFIGTVALAFSHHFSSLMMVVLMTTYMLYANVTKLESKFSIKMYLIIISTIFSYWIFVAFSPISTIEMVINGFIKGTFVTYQELAEINNLFSIRKTVIVCGTFIFYGIFALILIIKHKELKKLYGYVLFLFICGTGSVFAFFSPMTIFPDRYLTFGWLVGALPLVSVFFMIRSKTFAKYAKMIIFAFLIFNIYNIPPSFYQNPGIMLNQPNAEDLSTVTKIDMSSKLVLSTGGSALLVSNLYETKVQPIGFGVKNLHDLREIVKDSPNYFDIIMVNRKMDYMLNDEGIKLQYGSYVALMNYVYYNYNKILCSNNVYYYSR